MFASRILHLSTISLVSICLFLAAPSSQAQSREPTAEEAVIIDRIRGLRRELAELLERLPAELHEAAREPAGEEAAPEPDPPAVAESEPEAPIENEIAVENEPPRVAKTEPVIETEPIVETEPTVETDRRRSRCGSLVAFDTTQDGVLDSRDRYWRYLDLWIDRDADGRIHQREILSTYDQKIEEIATDLDWFEGRRVSYGQIRFAEHVVLDLRGDGFGGRGDAVLVVDASALRRGDGPSLLDAGGAEVEGTVPLTRGFKIVDGEGRTVTLGCP